MNRFSAAVVCCVLMYSFNSIAALNAQTLKFSVDPADPNRGTASKLQACTDVPDVGRWCSNGSNVASIQTIIGIASFRMQQVIKESSAEIEASAENSDNNIGKLLIEMAELKNEVRTMNNNQLIAIRDQIITRIEALPMNMVDDPEIRKMVREMVVEVVADTIASPD